LSSDPAHDPLPRYSFLPWARRGVAANIDQVDHLGITPAAGPAARATITAALTVEIVPVPGAPAAAPSAITKTVGIVGPGDVKAFQPAVVLRAVPAPGAANATPGELAFVEFYDEDFPWRYTPARATPAHRLRPWLALLVLQAGADAEFDLLPRPGELSILEVHDGVTLPPVTESWAWAHVQTSGDLSDVDNLDDFVSHAPDHALSRLMSPRRLRPVRDYHAFVVPALETGRRAGLGDPDPTVPAQQPSWGTPAQNRFPVLYDWAFRTAEVSDFETLARRPQPFPVGESFGKRDLDLSDPGAGLPAATAAHLEGALRPIEFPRVAFPGEPGAGLRDALRELVDRSEDYRDDDPAAQPDDPVITPPAYARLPAGAARVADAAAVTPQLDWLVELNADPRNRAAAGLGAMIVQQRDEELMARAWAQVDELNSVNQRLREADLALAASERIYGKHVAGDDADRLLQLTAAVQSAVAIDGTKTVRGAVEASRVPAAAQSTAFRRIARPQRRLIRAVQADGLRAGLVTRLNAGTDQADALSTAPPAPEPGAGVDIALVTAAVTGAVAQLTSQPIKPREQFLLIAYDEVQALGGAAVTAVTDAGDVADLQQALHGRLDGAVPPPAGADDQIVALRKGVGEIIDAVARLDPDPSGQAIITIETAVFESHFGNVIDGKTYRGLTAAPPGSALTNTATAADPARATAFADDFGAFTTLAGRRPVAVQPDPLTAPSTVAGQVASAMHPRTALPARLNTVVQGAGTSAAALVQTRRLRPVLAHPRFPDPMFEPLRLLGQDYVLPNIADLPRESIAVMEPNGRFIESLMAGASTELARELLWNEFPTDQRGTYFSRFWDARDAGVDAPPADIRELTDWTGQLGGQSGRAGGLLMLVVRAELLVKFPNTVVFAQHGKYVTGGRALDDAGDVKCPVLRGHLDPDIELYGFELTPVTAAGTATDAGYFFCFMERPGQNRFGLDLADPPPVLDTWDALAWAHLAGDADLVTLGGANAGLAPTTAGLPGWNQTAAHQAAILCQSPVLLARHATDMLPEVPHE
jgi:hypothetical protein